jgi:hypothetical protein
MAKSLVAPLKSVTVPRLELTAAFVSAKVGTSLPRELDYNEINEIFWTGSKVVLGYIFNNVRRFHVFVSNRVQQIRDLTSVDQWRYIPTKSNPADFASRCLDAQCLLDKRNGAMVRIFSGSLDTSSFLNAYRRFVGRRGPIRQLKSDRRTIFVGSVTELQAALSEMNQETVRQQLLKENCDFIKFQMNVLHASHIGGSWERQIRSVRNVLSALLDTNGEQPDDESLRTVMVEAEAIINSRPLSLNFASELEPLTPNHLLTLKSNIILPSPGEFQRADVYSKKRWRRVQYLINEFWSHWKKEFLQSLQTRQKWVQPQKNLKKGDIVVVNDEDLPRNQWKLARVAETFPSDDGLVRKVVDIEVVGSTAVE